MPVSPFTSVAADMVVAGPALATPTADVRIIHADKRMDLERKNGTKEINCSAKTKSYE
jgi:hypothetical protein